MTVRAALLGILASGCASTTSSGYENRPGKILVPTETGDGVATTPETIGGKGKEGMDVQRMSNVAAARSSGPTRVAPPPRVRPPPPPR